MAPRRQPLPGQHGMTRLAGGPQAFVDALLSRLPADACRTEWPVARIEGGGEGIRLTAEDGRSVGADRVVLALPPRVAAAGIAFDPPLPPEMVAAMAATPTWMAQQAKALMLFDRPFWREAGLSGRIASAVGPLVEAHDHCSADGTAALFGFVGWPPERRGADLAEAIRAQLRRCFGTDAPEPRRVHVEDWARAPRVCSPRDLSEPPRHPSPGPDVLRAAHWKGRLHLAGAESAERGTGLIEGALLSAERVAADILARPARSA